MHSVGEGHNFLGHSSSFSVFRYQKQIISLHNGFVTFDDKVYQSFEKYKKGFHGIACTLNPMPYP